MSKKLSIMRGGFEIRSADPTLSPSRRRTTQQPCALTFMCCKIGGKLSRKHVIFVLPILQFELLSSV